MKKTFNFFYILFLFTTTSLSAQITIIRSVADSLRDEGNLNGAIIEFQKMLKEQPKDVGTLYNYTCVLSLANQRDSCFKNLYKYIEMDTTVQPLCDPDFLNARQDKRWTDFENKLINQLNIKFQNPYKDIEYAKKLWEMNALDQAYYDDIKLVEKKIGMHSSVSNTLWQMKIKINEKNQSDLIELIEKKGWPKSSEVGGRAASSAFLIIQHSDSEKQKKYLPIIKSLCEQKEASWSSYALMYDRIQISMNKPQKYGSQITFNNAKNTYELSPLEDETMVDEWRKEMGLQPLADYVSRWNIKFEPKKK